MKKLILNVALFLIGFILPVGSVSAQMAARLEPYFDSYTKFVTSNARDSIVLMYQKGRIVSDTNNLKLRLGAKFSPKTFSTFSFLIVGGYGTNTPVRSSVIGSQSSDLDLDMLFKIDDGKKADISAVVFKQQVALWLRDIYPDTNRYKIFIKDPVVAVEADTTFPDNTNLKYQIEIGSFNQLKDPKDSLCLPAQLCSELAWGINTSSWQETTSPSFPRNFNQKFLSDTIQGRKVFSDCKMLKYWNKYANYDINPDNIPPSISYLIAAYNWLTWPPAPNTYRLQQLIVMVDSLRKNVFNNDCSNVRNARLNVPFFTAADPNVLSKMDTVALKRFCNSLKKLSDTLQFVSAQTDINRALLALSNVFPDFNNAPPGTYNIQPYSSLKVIYPKNGGVADGDTIVQITSTNDASKKWVITNIEASQGKFYYTIKNQKSQRALDVYNKSTAAGAPIVQNQFNNNDSQLWEIVFLEYLNNGANKLYKVVNKKSKLVMDAGPSSTDNAVTTQANPNTTTSQKWYLIEVPGL
ncbi:MAG: RICIN domain-containing protein [Chitinophaga sp.]|uniref:RICIN domain-containing protein n=1 Tax=Chitinophaga sp. TaxID=1869181 RepID=UPI0025BF38A3|nr:RICIN domain-containing protein [Chitinophaga sp.]MBV8254254.1 RICIN domain-containing protein [Chitinophaga sp.]